MLEAFVELFSYGFLVRAVAAGLMLSVCAALLGVGLVLKRYAMIGDGIALLSTSSLSIGVLVISITTGMNTDVCNFMFGTILGTNMSDVYLSIALCAFCDGNRNQSQNI
jgi:zinc transport system permease protein